jgi:hypothetical protein
LYDFRALVSSSRVDDDITGFDISLSMTDGYVYSFMTKFFRQL